MFVDDHMEIWQLFPDGNKWTTEAVVSQIEAAFSSITEHQLKWDVTMGEEKNRLIIELHGKGSQKVTKQIGSRLSINGTTLVVTTSCKYLGAHIGHPAPSTDMELNYKVKKTNEAMDRLKRVWPMEHVPIKTKLHLYVTLVRPITLYALESRTLTTPQIQRLEALQTRHIRRISKSQSFLDHETNEALRERLGVTSFASELQKRRLQFWRRLQTPHNYFVRNAMFGQPLDTEGNPHELQQADAYLQQLATDLHELGTTNQANMQDIQYTKGQLQINQAAITLTQSMTKSQINKMGTHTSTVERSQQIKFGPSAPPPLFLSPPQLQ